MKIIYKQVIELPLRLYNLYPDYWVLLYDKVLFNQNIRDIILKEIEVYEYNYK
jgi:hypothetical protein